MAKKRLGVVLARVAAMVSTAVSVLVHSRLRQAPCLPPGTQEIQTIPYGVAISVGICIGMGGVFAWRVW